MQCRLWPRNDEERQVAKAQHIDLSRIYTLNDLVTSENIFFAATGITDGELLSGVHYFSDGATTQTLVMRATSGTVRYINSTHKLSKLRSYYHIPFD
jgi:fructose-1,6-bisphosphatase II